MIGALTRARSNVVDGRSSRSVLARRVSHCSRAANVHVHVRMWLFMWSEPLYYYSNSRGWRCASVVPCCLGLAASHRLMRFARGDGGMQDPKPIKHAGQWASRASCRRSLIAIATVVVGSRGSTQSTAVSSVRRPPCWRAPTCAMKSKLQSCESRGKGVSAVAASSIPGLIAFRNAGATGFLRRTLVL